MTVEEVFGKVDEEFIKLYTLFFFYKNTFQFFSRNGDITALYRLVKRLFNALIYHQSKYLPYSHKFLS